ncbi:MAG TPA: tetratricopeptide repeat protein [Verrucomicrobiae bacterium]|jgi:Tfp pilus assembly protein PilF
MPQKDCGRKFAVCLLLAIGTIALYFPALHFNFVNVDDVYVTANPNVNHGLTGHGLAWAFQAGYAGNWHPVTWISHMADAQVFGARAGWHHAMNLLLHVLNSMLVFLVLSRMTGAFWRSAAVAAFFAWHPLQVEPVAWIADRKDLLCGFFGLLALWSYVRYAENPKEPAPINRKLFYILALVFFTIGLMAKPMLVTLPFILLLIDWWPLQRLGLPVATGEQAVPQVRPASVVSLLIEKIPFFLLSIASGVITLVAEHSEEAMSVVAHLPLKTRFVTAVVAYFRYIEKLVWPADLGASYPYIYNLPKWQLAAIALLLVGITYIAINVRKSRPYWTVGWFWFVVMLIPTLNVLHTGAQPLADRYMYLSSLGLLILICWDATDLAAQWPSGRLALSAVGALALVGCFVASSMQLQYWRNEGKLLSRIADPNSNFAGHASYASFLAGAKQFSEAEAECEKAITIMPNYPVLQAEMGDILLSEGKYDAAIQRFQTVQKMEPRMVNIHLPWGRALLAQKKIEPAMAEFQTVIKAEPKNFEAYNYLGQAFASMGRTGTAIEEYQRSLTMQPNQPDLLNNLAWIYATDPHPEFRNGTNAVRLAQAAFAMTRNTQPIFLGTMAAGYAEAGHFDDAVMGAQKAHDMAVADADVAEKAGRTAVAHNLQALADREIKLMQLYKSHKPFRDQPPAKN